MCSLSNWPSSLARCSSSSVPDVAVAVRAATQVAHELLQVGDPHSRFAGRSALQPGQVAVAVDDDAAGVRRTGPKSRSARSSAACRGSGPSVPRPRRCVQVMPRSSSLECGPGHVRLTWSALQLLASMGMDYRLLGSDRSRVSELCLGAMMFGRRVPTQTTAVLDTFTGAGGNFIDTADVYGRGPVRGGPRPWLKNRRREDLVVATKVWGRWGRGATTAACRASTPRRRGASLSRLGTDHIDLYQVHGWDDGTPLDRDAVDAGFAGTQRQGPLPRREQLPGWQVQKAVDLCHRHGWEPPAPCSRCTRCWTGRPNGSWCPSAATRASA